MNTATSDERLCATRTLPGLWTSLLGPAVLWLVQFQVIYTVVGWACATHHREVIPITSGVSLLLAAATGAFTFRFWQELSRAPQEISQRRSRFMLDLGLMMSALFALLIAAQGVAILFVDPCKS